MSKQLEKVKITASILPKADEKMRLRAVREKLSLGELLEKYQMAYDEKIELERQEEKLNRELTKGNKIKCPWCGLIISQKK